MAKRVRIANKTIWALEDITARCHTASGRWSQAMSFAEQESDHALLSLLGRLRDDLATIERLAKDARHGEYQDTGGIN